MFHYEPNDSLADKLRMAIWLLIGIGLYAAAKTVGPDDPITQVVCQKLGNVTTFAWAGYQVARGCLGRITSRSTAGDKQARAIVVGAAIIAGALGI